MTVSVTEPHECIKIRCIQFAGEMQLFIIYSHQQLTVHQFSLILELSSREKISNCLYFILLSIVNFSQLVNFWPA